MKDLRREQRRSRFSSSKEGSSGSEHAGKPSRPYEPFTGKIDDDPLHCRDDLHPAVEKLKGDEV